MSTELNLCCVEATDLIREAVGHVLNQSSCEEKLRQELLQWRDGVPGEGKRRQEEPEYCWGEGAAIPFELVVKIHQQLKAHPLGQYGCFCLLSSVLVKLVHRFYCVCPLGCLLVSPSICR